MTRAIQPRRRSLSAAMLALLLGSACASLEDSLLADFSAPLPPPDPTRGSIGVQMGFSALIKLVEVRPDAAYFVRLDDSLEPYASQDLIWSQYSRNERLAFLPFATRVIRSNRLQGDLYLLNAEPGRYLAVGGRTSQQSNDSMASRGEGMFASELIAQTEVVVRPGRMSFMGDIGASSTLRPGDLQAHYLKRIAPHMTTWTTGSLLGNALKEGFKAAWSGRQVDVPYWLMADRFSRDPEVQRAFRERTLRRGFGRDPAWAQVVGRSDPGPAPPAGASDISRLEAQAGYAMVEGDQAEAIALLERALRLAESRWSGESSRLAALLTNLADVHLASPDYARARPLYERALAIREKTLGPRHPGVANSLASLARVYRGMGDMDGAKSLLERALELREQALGPRHLHVSDDLGDLASVQQSRGELAEGVARLERALAIRTEVLGERHPRVAKLDLQLASLREAQGDAAEAERLLARAAAIQEGALGAWHPDLADSLARRAELARLRGRPVEAARWAERALAIRKRALGNDHPSVADSLVQLALVRQSSGQRRDVIALLSRAGAIRERQLALVLATGSEAQKLRFSAHFARETSLILSFHLNSARDDPEAARLALTTLLQRKGRVLDATAESLRTLRSHLEPGDSGALETLNAARARLATLTFRGPGELPAEVYRTSLSEAGQELEALEAEVSARGARLKSRPTAVDLDAVRARLTPDTSLIEFASYEPFDFDARQRNRMWGARRYAAYTLGADGEVRWADLGSGRAIDRSATALRNALGIHRTADPHQPARAADEIVFRPVRRLLGESQHLLVSPDGALNLIPFAALVDEQDRYLIERYQISYLASGRDLVRREKPRADRSRAWIVAAPDFDAAPVNVSPASTAVTPHDQRARKVEHFSPLPGTAVEARALAALLPEATLRVGREATESAVKALHGPIILHIATHGFFLSDDPPPAAVGRSIAIPFQETEAEPLTRDPLLRSGIALAGANRASGSGEDGILTAVEASGLDLWGTELVALSACETGLGDVVTGEGVFGLRRALVTAGSESQLISLWKVDDAATTDLMTAFYGRLRSGEGRSQALRRVQLDMLGSRWHRHPYYWASFIHSGEWSPIWSPES